MSACSSVHAPRARGVRRARPIDSVTLHQTRMRWSGGGARAAGRPPSWASDSVFLLTPVSSQGHVLGRALRKAGVYAPTGETDEPVPERARKVSIAVVRDLAVGMDAAFKYKSGGVRLFNQPVPWSALR